jgi:hypothetical protein
MYDIYKNIPDYDKEACGYFKPNLTFSESLIDSNVSAKPNGNLLSGKTDEEIFECSYRQLKVFIQNGLNDLHMPYGLRKVLKDNAHKLTKTTFNPITF